MDAILYNHQFCWQQSLVIGYVCRVRSLSLLLLAAPTWLWSRCGRHNSPPASYVMDFIFRRSDGSHVLVDTVHPSLLRSSSHSSPRWYHIQSLSSDIVLVSPLRTAKPRQCCCPAHLSDTLYIQSIPDIGANTSEQKKRDRADEKP